MTRIRTYDGYLLYIDGRLIIDNECCCVDDCPDCPDITTLPTLCYLRVNTRFGQAKYMWLGSQETRPAWVVSTTQDDDPGTCYIYYGITLGNPCCVANCDDSETQELITGDSWYCLYTGEPDSDPGAGFSPVGSRECPENADRLYCYDMYYELDGVIRWGQRSVMSTFSAEVEFRQNCETMQKQRRITYTYLYSQDVRGRFEGHQYVGEVFRKDGMGDLEICNCGGEDPPCGPNGDPLSECPGEHCCDDTETDTPLNIGRDACDCLPQFPDVECVDGFDHPDWVNDLLPCAGLQASCYGKIRYTEGWVNVDEFFEAFQATPDQVAVDPDTGLHLCEGEDDVEYRGDAQRTFDPYIPDGDFISKGCWECNESNTDGLYYPWVVENPGPSCECDEPPDLQSDTWGIDDPFEPEHIEFETSPAETPCDAESDCPPDDECEWRCWWIGNEMLEWELIVGRDCKDEAGCGCEEPVDPPEAENDITSTDCTIP